MPSQLADSKIIDDALNSLSLVGHAVIPAVIEPALLAQTREAMHYVQERIIAEIGSERLERAGELGVLRAPMRYEPLFFRYLGIVEILEIIDRTIGETAILHLQNGFVLPSFRADETPFVFQNVFHRDFPRHLNGYLASVNVMVAVDAFTAVNGATLVVSGSHQRAERPDPEFMARAAIPVTCEAGSLVIFDSTLWHAAGANMSGGERLAINHQFTRPWIKQQIDYVRALGDEVVLAQAPRTQQLLGWYSRVVETLDQYYQPVESRLYRSNQG